MRTIDADALIEKCGDWYVEEGTESGFIGTLKNLLATMPTVQPEKAQLFKEGTTKDTTSELPTIQPEPTRIITETRAIPSDDDRVSLSEKVTATFYNDEYEEWSQKTVTVRDVLDAVCDEYTVLPTIQPEPKEGHWIPHKSPDGGEQYECSRCGVLWEFTDGTPEDNEAYFCPKCGKKLITK